MIVNRYLQRNIYQGTCAALLVLVSLSLFFIFIGEIENLGQGSYGLLQAVEYIALKVPGQIVEFTPLAILLGTILSLGALAGNSEIIAMQASGISLPRLLGSIFQAALVVALINFVLADIIVPESETAARKVRSQTQKQSLALKTDNGVWIKDESKILFIGSLLPNGVARDVDIYQLDENGKLVGTTRAKRAIPIKKGWQLEMVEKSTLGAKKAVSQSLDTMIYQGNISHELLQVLLIEPRQMSIGDLWSYLKFLDENKLEANTERLVLWKKIFSPLSIIVMCLLAFPFILGAQRQANSGQRLMLGILIGLAFVVVDRLLTQLGIQWKIAPVLIALLPNMVFFGLAFYLLKRKLSHGLKRVKRSALARG
ncbi:MAG: lipopolysaccharide export system permease protein [Gammaproteobacteria bacterium]|jgi:lipopolysaccharide export system permease protein